MDEFALIERYFAVLGGDTSGVLCGIGDDAAVLAPPPVPLAVAVDTLVEGVHFPPDIAPDDLGFRAAAVNLSDLAAMGATPRYATLALTVPAAEPRWLAGFARGLADALRPSGTVLIGGDTTRGPLTVTVQLIGLLHGPALYRAGARSGDLVAVSGTLGDARGALDVLEGTLPVGFAAADRDWLLQRYLRPRARTALGIALGGLAHAAIDVSDGLVADLGHVAAASGVAIEIDLSRLPLSAALGRLAGAGTARDYAASGGDDYELAFTFPPAALTAVRAAALQCGDEVTVIGRVTDGAGVRCLDADGRDRTPPTGGYRHFT